MRSFSDFGNAMLEVRVGVHYIPSKRHISLPARSGASSPRPGSRSSSQKKRPATHGEDEHHQRGDPGLVLASARTPCAARCAHRRRTAGNPGRRTTGRRPAHRPTRPATTQPQRNQRGLRAKHVVARRRRRAASAMAIHSGSAAAARALVREPVRSSPTSADLPHQEPCKLAGQEGIEPPTCGFGDRRSAN